jgi:hypothetical protein
LRASGGSLYFRTILVLATVLLSLARRPVVPKFGFCFSTGSASGPSLPGPPLSRPFLPGGLSLPGAPPRKETSCEGSGFRDRGGGLREGVRVCLLFLGGGLCDRDGLRLRRRGGGRGESADRSLRRRGLVERECLRSLFLRGGVAERESRLLLGKGDGDREDDGRRLLGGSWRRGGRSLRSGVVVEL